MVLLNFHEIGVGGWGCNGFNELSVGVYDGTGSVYGGKFNPPSYFCICNC
jgi:hypothetical protein